jgi:hypothetical protein
MLRVIQPKVLNGCNYFIDMNNNLKNNGCNEIPKSLTSKFNSHYYCDGCKKAIKDNESRYKCSVW